MHIWLPVIEGTTPLKLNEWVNLGDADEVDRLINFGRNELVQGGPLMFLFRGRFTMSPYFSRFTFVSAITLIVLAIYSLFAEAPKGEAVSISSEDYNVSLNSRGKTDSSRFEFEFQEPQPLEQLPPSFVQLPQGVTNSKKQEARYVDAPFSPQGHFESTINPVYANFQVGPTDILFMHGIGGGESDFRISYNQGLSWHANAYGTPGDIKVAPNDANHILIGTSNGLYRSNNRGQNWELLDSTVMASKIEFSPNYAQDGHILAWSGGQRFFMSNDRGQSWTPKTLPLYLSTGMAFSPNYENDGTIFATFGSSEIYKSLDQGITWQELFDFNFAYIYEIKFSPDYAVDNTMFARTDFGVYQSVDKGVSWERFAPFEVLDFELHPNYASNQTFYIVATLRIDGIRQTDALFVTRDDGETYQGLIANVIDFELSPDTVSNSTMYAMIASGVVQSKDNGNSWFYRSYSDEGSIVKDMAVSPAFDSDGTIFMVRKGSNNINQHLIWRSQTFGLTWQKFAVPFETDSSVMRIALSPNYQNDQTVLLLIGSWLTPASVYQSQDGGESWTALNLNLPIGAGRDPHIRLSPNYSIDKTIFVSGYLEGLFRSTDNGRNWERLYDADAITDIAVAPDYPTDQRLFVSVYGDGISRSNDGGVTWSSPIKPGGLALLINLSPNLSTDNTMYAFNSGTSGGGVWRSDDAGDSWSTAGAGLSYYVDASAISPNYASDATVAVQIQSRGLYLSEDAGTTWFRLAGGVLHTQTGHLALPYRQGRVMPIASATDGFYIYIWPQVTAGYLCTTLELDSSDTQTAALNLNMGRAETVPWRIESGQVSWLSTIEEEGTTPTMPQLQIRSDGIVEAAVDTLTIDYSLSYRVRDTLEVPVFLPCGNINLPVVTK